MSYLKQLRLLPAIAVLAMASSSSLAKAEVVLVTSTKSPVNSLTTNQVVDIFLGKAEELPNGAPIIPVDQAEGSNEKEEFYKRYTNRTLSQIRAYWSKLIFTGKGEPPKEIGDREQLKQYLATHPNSIGYLERDKVGADLKIVFVVKN
jgi:ABC-type phosphate transport system substrate-binding protein